MGLLFSGLGDEKTRGVFFSFHYARDIFRTQIVKNHWVTKGTQKAAGFFDRSLEEESKTKGDDAVKRLINDGLNGSSVTCVLIGQETYTRRWVDYEILKSLSEGMGLFGVRVHQIQCAKTKTVDSLGNNPFHYIGLLESSGSDKLWGAVEYTSGWKWNQLHTTGIARGVSDLVPRYGAISRLSDIINVYDWVDDDGFNNFPRWVARAAQQAGR